MNISFRSALTVSDVTAIGKMVEETGFFRTDEVEIAVELVEDKLQKGDSSSYRFLIAETDGEMVAYACFGLIPCSLLSWDLYWIVTKAGLQGKGIGTTLLRMAEKEIASAGGKQVIIETSSKELYASTQSFYHKNGYRLHTRFPDFYDYGDDKLVFVKTL
jgi:ribosomal protein S18 acetylase RimI-like enzyme